MLIPVARQTRRQSFLADGSVVYEVTTQIIDSGDLPFPHLFVLQIVDNGDPKDDVLARIATPADIRQADPTSPIYVKVVETDLIYLGVDPFARVANVNDVTALPRDRVVAQRRGLTFYLATAVTQTYTTVTTAEAASRTILDRLSTLVTEWRAFQTEFATNPYQDYNLPQTPPSVEAVRIAAYTQARTARMQAEAARDAAAAAKVACAQTDEANKAIYEIVARDVSFLTTSRSTVLAITETVTGCMSGSPVASTNAKDYALQTGSYSGDPTSYQALLVERQNLQAVYAARILEDTARCNTVATTLLQYQQAVDAAQTAEREALANVLAVCPTFDPSTV